MSKAKKRVRKPGAGNSFRKQERLDRVMREMDAWGKGRPQMIVNMAYQAAAMADDLYEGVRWFIGDKNLPERVPDPPALKDWLPLYRDHDRTYDVLGAAGFGLDRSGPGSASGIAAMLRQASRMDREELERELRAMPPDELRKYLAEGIGMGREMNQAVRDDVKSALGGGDEASTEDEDRDMAAMVRQPEYQFFFRVWFPCCTVYRTTPIRLFRDARCRDIDAMEKLIRLDKSVIGDWIIGDHWHRAMHARNKNDAKRLRKAASSNPKGKLTRGRFKNTLAGIVSGLAGFVTGSMGKHLIKDIAGNEVNWNLTEADCRDLFDIVARYRGAVNDGDLPKNPWGYSKALSRERDYLIKGGLIPGQKIV